MQIPRETAGETPAETLIEITGKGVTPLSLICVQRATKPETGVYSIGPRPSAWTVGELRSGWRAAERLASSTVARKRLGSGEAGWDMEQGADDGMSAPAGGKCRAKSDHAPVELGDLTIN